MKRKLSMLLSIILVVTSFVGCDDDNNVNDNVTTTPPVAQYYDNSDIDKVEETIVKVVEFFPVQNDRDLTIHLADVPDVFRKIGDDLSVSIGWILASETDGTDLDLGSINEGNLYYSSEYNLLSLNLFTDINQEESDIQGSLAGEKISLDYDLNENTIIRNESSEYFADDTDVIVDVMLSLYNYATTKVDTESEIDETETNENSIEEVTVDTEVDTAITDETLVKVPAANGPITQEELDEFEDAKTDPNNYLSYKGSSVMELFAYDVNNYTMADFTVLSYSDDVKAINSDIIDALNGYTSKTPDSYAYFIKTHNFETNETEKQYVYLDNSNEMLLDYCKNEIADDFQYPSWITHMSEENVKSVKISQSLGTNGGTVDITDTKTAQQIANTLKGNLLVMSLNNATDGKSWIIPNSNSDYTLIYITFNNGVEYHIQLLNGNLQIYTSDLDKTLTYKMYSSPYDTINNMLASYL